MSGMIITYFVSRNEISVLKSIICDGILNFKSNCVSFLLAVINKSSESNMQLSVKAYRSLLHIFE